MTTPVRVLSIDGGGIRGIIPALVLAEIEKRTAQPICRLFDLIAGTSTGSILALGLTAGKSQPLLTALDLAQLYEAEGANIFRASPLRRAMQLTRSRYAADGMDRVFKKYFTEASLACASTPVVIPCYEIERRTPWFFRSERAKNCLSYEFKLYDVARSACAAPTYFPPSQIWGWDGSWSLIDGAMFANNPAMIAWTEAGQMYPGRSVTMVSLGTGSLTRPIPFDKANGWGKAGWLPHVLDVVFDGVSSTVDFQLAAMLRNYWRLQPQLLPANQALDNVDPGNLKALRKTALKMILDNSAKLDQICDALVNGPAGRIAA